ncbi:GhoT/OrtT family toxin [Martelella alba]|uniref:GhoT/OrtT family toxin n=1 Tax=Martelella alba TaxID=2590451 RepID=A0ABY2SJ64_9HYPH|nr:GhoT/OrtT family toxin [Martelella alba]TKI05501.1 GhoT/OrtT family toxin [Martelella alba]
MDIELITGWDYIKLIYSLGVAISGIITYRVSCDPSWKIRALCAVLIAFTWPLSFPIVVVMLLL